MCHMAWGDKMMDGKKTKKEWCKQDNFAVKYKHKPMLPDDSIYDYFYLSIKTIRTNVIGNQISLVNKKKFFIDLVPLYVLEMQTQRQRAEVLLCLTAWCIFEVMVFFPWSRWIKALSVSGELREMGFLRELDYHHVLGPPWEVSISVSK